MGCGCLTDGLDPGGVPGPQAGLQEEGRSKGGSACMVLHPPIPIPHHHPGTGASASHRRLLCCADALTARWLLAHTGEGGGHGGAHAAAARCGPPSAGSQPVVSLTWPLPPHAARSLCYSALLQIVLLQKGSRAGGTMQAASFATTICIAGSSTGGRALMCDLQMLERHRCITQSPHCAEFGYLQAGGRSGGVDDGLGHRGEGARRGPRHKCSVACRGPRRS